MSNWNLLSPKSNTPLHAASFAFSPAKIIWSFDGMRKGWMAFSPNRTIAQRLIEHKIPQTLSLGVGEGFWVLSPTTFTVDRLKDHIYQMEKSAPSSATVSQAKELMGRIRDTFSSFDDNNLTAFAGIYKNRFNDQIRPTITTVGNTLKTNLDHIETLVNTFVDDLNSSFQPITNSLAQRIEGWSDLLHTHDLNSSWSASVGGDTLTYTYEGNDRGLLTVTGEGASITLAMHRQSQNEDDENWNFSFVTTGTSTLSGPGYNLTLATVDINSSRGIHLNASGTLTATAPKNGSAAVDLNLTAEFDPLDHESPAMLNNTTLTLSGTVTSDDRTFTGSITLADANRRLNIISGTLKGKNGEPTFEGRLSTNLSPEDLAQMAKDDEDLF
ncbi:MAG: hypothetical protein K6347_04105, partial [Campylobacterales bacterium]